MEQAQALLMADRNGEITAALKRERAKLASFIRRRVRDPWDAEDLLQDVCYEFARAYRLPEPIEQAGAWLFRVARNRIVDRFRRKSTHSLSSDIAQFSDDDTERALDLALPSPDDGPDALAARSMILAAIQQALEELPWEQREAFLAHELGGESFKELSSKTGVPINTLLARKRYAVMHLRDRLQPLYDELDI